MREPQAKETTARGRSPGTSRRLTGVLKSVNLGKETVTCSFSLISYGNLVISLNYERRQLTRDRSIYEFDVKKIVNILIPYYSGCRQHKIPFAISSL